MRRPLLLLSAAFAAGCFVGDALAAGPAWALVCFAGALLPLALRARPGTALGALGAAALALGAAGASAERRAYEATALAHWIAVHPDLEDPVRLGGVAAADTPDGAVSRTIVIDVETLTDVRDARAVSGRARIVVGGDAPLAEIVAGDRLALWATLRPPRGFANPGSFDVVAQALRDGVHAHGFCKSARLVTIGGRGRIGLLTGAAAQARAWARRTLRRFVLAGPEEGLVRAMTLGDRTGVDATTSERFRRAGTYHVLAISGAQVALVAGLLLWLARRVGAGPLSSAVTISALLAFYALLVGGDTPVVRAAVMAAVLLGGRALDLDADLANLLGAAALVLLAARPSSATDVAFQLSFTATLGILLLAEPLVARLPRLPLRAEALVAASLAAQLPLVPLLAASFHRVPWLALPLNLLAVPLSGAVLLAGLAVLVIAVVAPPLAPLAGDVAWIAGHALLRSADVVRLLPALDVRVPSPPVFATALVFAGCWVVTRRRGRGLALASLGVCGIVCGPAAPAGDGRLHVTVLDVGQGDALVLRSPTGRVWLVDAGGAYPGGLDLGEAVVAPYLWSQGVRGADRLLLTHAHPDHVGGARAVLQAIPVEDVWEGPAPRHDAVYDVLDGELRGLGVQRRSVARGVRTTWDDVAVEVVGPRPRGAPWRARNDDSVVLALTWGGVRLLLAGDMEAAEERELPPLPSLVLKVPHHGSRTSSTPAFLSATGMRVALVSVGARNRFGHPAADVLDRYRRAGALVLRTDRDGAIDVATDGRRVWIRTFRSGGPDIVL